MSRRASSPLTAFHHPSLHFIQLCLTSVIFFPRRRLTSPHFGSSHSFCNHMLFCFCCIMYFVVSRLLFLLFLSASFPSPLSSFYICLLNPLHHLASHLILSLPTLLFYFTSSYLSPLHSTLSHSLCLSPLLCSALFFPSLIFQDTLPYNDYFEYFGPDYRLHLPVSNMENLNTAKYLQEVKLQVKRHAH